jgi:hypothetical protein
MGIEELGLPYGAMIAVTKLVPGASTRLNILRLNAMVGSVIDKFTGSDRRCFVAASLVGRA